MLIVIIGFIVTAGCVSSSQTPKATVQSSTPDPIVGIWDYSDNAKDVQQVGYLEYQITVGEQTWVIKNDGTATKRAYFSTPFNQDYSYGEYRWKNIGNNTYEFKLVKNSQAKSAELKVPTSTNGLSDLEKAVYQSLDSLGFHVVYMDPTETCTYTLKKDQSGQLGLYLSKYQFAVFTLRTTDLTVKNDQIVGAWKSTDEYDSVVNSNFAQRSISVNKQYMTVANDYTAKASATYISGSNSAQIGGDYMWKKTGSNRYVFTGVPGKLVTAELNNVVIKPSAKNEYTLGYDADGSVCLYQDGYSFPSYKLISTPIQTSTPVMDAPATPTATKSPKSPVAIAGLLMGLVVAGVLMSRRN